jgi:hypothetical protein
MVDVLYIDWVAETVLYRLKADGEEDQQECCGQQHCARRWLGAVQRERGLGTMWWLRFEAVVLCKTVTGCGCTGRSICGCRRRVYCHGTKCMVVGSGVGGGSAVAWGGQSFVGCWWQNGGCLAMGSGGWGC